MLILLDNAETLIEAVDARESAALNLADLLKRLPGRTVSLLVTSRRLLEWPGELSLELGGSRLRKVPRSSVRIVLNVQASAS